MNNPWIQGAVCLAIGYLLGCFSPAYLIGKLKGYDVRKSGSGNAGASNTLLLAGKLAGLTVALVDILKAAAAWWICEMLFPEMRLAGILGGVSAVLGHMFPVFLGFHGGKGLACLAGVGIAYDPEFFLLMLAMALLIGIASKYVCVVTTAMAFIGPAYYGHVTGFWLGAAILAVPAIPIFIKHIPNFKRIAAGEELKLRFLWKREEELERIQKK